MNDMNKRELIFLDDLLSHVQVSRRQGSVFVKEFTPDPTVNPLVVSETLRMKIQKEIASA